MKKKFLSSLILVSVSMSMGMPVFAADQQHIVGPSPQTGKVPVTGSIEKYIPPTPSEINVSIPTDMAFNVGFNKDKQKAELTSADYTITNNGDQAVNVTSEYDVTDASGVTFTSPDKVKPGDSNLEMALSLNAGKDANPTTPWIQNVTDKATGNSINLASKGVEHMQFSSTDQGLANITQHAKDGKLDSEVDVKGNLVLTFTSPQQAVNITDTNLKTAINKKLGQADDSPITIAQLQGLTGTLDFSNKSINNLEGIQYCTNINELNLNSNNISNIEPLKGLTNLTSLSLDNGKFTDITPLSNLKNLTFLNISRNSNISDITPIANLTKLGTLFINQDKISNIGVLKGLTKLNLTTDTTFNGTDQSIVLPDVNSTGGSATINNPLVGSDGNPLVPTDISNGGKYNKDNNTITFDNITKDETVTFKFSEKGKNFNGTVTANIKYKPAK